MKPYLKRTTTFLTTSLPKLRSPSILLLLAASLSGPMLLIWVTSYHQLSLSDDSVNYISAADSLRQGRALITFTGAPYVNWPPMLPCVLALLSFTGIPAIRAAVIINASSWFGTAITSGVWLREVTGSPILACAIAFWISISAPLVSVALYVWSEVLFSFFLILSLWTLHRYLSGRGSGGLLIAGLSGASATLTRYVGTVLLGSELLVLSLFALVQRRFWLLIGFAAIATVPVSTWIVRNVIVGGSATGMRYAGDESLRKVLYSTLNEVGSWFIPQPSAHINVLAGAGILICQAAGIALSLRSVLRQNYSPLHISTLLVGTFSIAYLGAIVAASVLTNACCVGGRFEAPVFASFVLGATFSIIILMETTLSSSQSMLKTAIAIFVLLGTSVSLSSSVTRARTFVSHGPDGYSQARYLEPDWIAYAKELPPDVVMFSNAPAAVYLATGRRVPFTPWRRGFASSVNLDDRPAFARLVAATPRVLILWFKEDTWYYLFDLKALQVVVTLKLVADLTYVSVYEATTRQ